MSTPRVWASLPGADAAAVVALARAIESTSIDGILVGDHREDRPRTNCDDTYVVTAAAGAAAVTSYARIGVVLNLRGSSSPINLAEDLGVLDCLSAGRLEVVADVRTPAQQDDLRRVLGSWREWPLGDGRTMPVTPAPVQPSLPTVRVGDDAPVWHLWRGPLALDEVTALRSRRDDAGTTGVAIDLSEVPADEVERALVEIGTVLVPLLRCAAHEVETLHHDAITWLRQRTALHRSPAEQ